MTAHVYDARSSEAFVAEHPGILAAYQAEAMAGRLADTLGVGIVRCEPDQALFEPDGYCLVRYEVELDDRTPLVVGVRLFGDADAAEAFHAEALEPIATDLDGRCHRPPPLRLAATIPPLAAAVSVFPVDGELPALVVATDPKEMAEPLAAALPEAAGECRVALAHYGRRRGCALRYEVGDGGPGAVAYGKVGSGDRGRYGPAVTDALRSASPEFEVPEVLFQRPELGLVVFGAIAGAPRIAQALKARTRGEPAPPDAPPLRDAVEACGRMAATLHRVEVPLGWSRPLELELSVLRGGVDLARRYTPGLAEHLEPALDAIGVAAASTPAMPEVTVHGDFSYTQLLFAGARHGLVDFDGVCRGEPALDLGHFMAYLRFAVRKATGEQAPAYAELERELGDTFLEAYVTAGGLAPDGRAALEARTDVYEGVSLLRLAVHAWQKLKPARLGHILGVLDATVTRLSEAP